tara:strand:+ start:387 stop:584 length:198 start_codon:yes stop_codon:yes gene_type:complete
MLKIEYQCIYCGSGEEVSVHEDNLKSWKEDKELIQDALWYLTWSQREIMKTGTCGTCFEKQYPSC